MSAVSMTIDKCVSKSTNYYTVSSQQQQQQLIAQKNRDLLRKAKLEASKELEAARIKMQKER